jgi:nucleotide-binding universal stress UspA family protein
MTFLVGFDGSNTSMEALDLACTYAKALHADIEIVTSMEEGDSKDVTQIRAAEEKLERAETLAKARGISVQTHLLIRGMSPGEDVVQFATENQVDALFIGVRRRSKVGKLLFGSNAQYMILKAPCPVMTVK